MKNNYKSSSIYDGKYWQANVGDHKPYPSIVSRISRFQSYSDLNISQQDQSRICPQQ